MTDHELISMLDKVLTVGGAGKLRDLLSDDCVYESDYSRKTIVTPASIIERMEFVDSHITDEYRYSSKVVELKDVLRREPGADQVSCGCRLNPYGILLYLLDTVFPAAVAMEILDAEGKISKIWLSRDKSLFNLDFNRSEIDKDSPRDLPCTVKQLNQHDRQVRAMRDAFSGQHLDLIPEEITDGLYIWRKADEFMEDWLPANGYTVSESRVFPECIGYRCARNGLLYHHSCDLSGDSQCFRVAAGCPYR